MAGAQSEENMPEPPSPATRPVRTSPEPQRPPDPLSPEDPDGEDYEPVEDADSAIRVPKTSCDGKEIRRVVVVGARRVDPDDVRVTMKLRKGDICRDPAVTRDAKALWNMGYFDDLQIEADPLGAGIKLTIRVVERPAIRKVIYKGNDEVDDEDIDEALNLEEGTILSVPEVEDQADAVRQLYSEEGFFLADVKYELRRVPDNANQVDVIFIIDEGAEVEVRRISFVGNKELPAAELLTIMQTNETGMFSFLSDRNKFSRSAFDEDLTRVQAWYYDKGYLMMRPGRPRVELTADRAYVDITIPVEEGPRFRIREFDVMETDGAGNEVETIAPKQVLREMVELEPGDWFSRSRIAEGIERITRTYRDAGYALVEMVPGTDLDEENHLVDVTINILRGPPVYIERLHVRGNTKTRDAVIRREFRISEGDLYNQTRLEDGRALVNQLGYFERVDVSEEQGTARDQMVINVEVAEKPTGTFQVGAGFSSLESFIVTAQVQQQNLFGRGQTLGLNLQLSGIRQQIDLNFVEPWFLGSE
ncbi:MAG: outer membrane protein assembly factor BamA, partial [Polyangiales bacterium]